MLGKTIVETLVIKKQTSCETSFHQAPLPGLVLRIIFDGEKNWLHYYFYQWGGYS